MQPLLAVDCGNTRVHFGLFVPAAMLPAGVRPHDPDAQPVAPFEPVIATWDLEVPFRAATCAREFKSALAEAGLDINDDALIDRLTGSVVCASVNPKATEPVAGWARDRFGADRFVRLGRDVPIPIANRTRIPDQVGHDRLLNALAAAVLFPGEVCIVVDIGTAVTFDVVSADGAYEGGVIAPGMRLTTKSLYENTALLPLVDPTQLPARPNAIGRDTREAIHAALTFGFPGMIESIVRAVAKELGATNPHVISTGGDAAAIQDHVPLFERHVPDITLQGIRLAFERFLK